MSLNLLSLLNRYHPEERGQNMSQLPLFAVIILAIVAIAVVVLYVYLMIYIYKDAVKRQLNGELWLIILLLAPIFGIIVYFLVRKTKR